MIEIELLDTTKQKKIRKQYNDLGISISGLKVLPIVEWNRIYNTLYNLFKQFPEVPKGFLKRIIIVKGKNAPKIARVRPNIVEYQIKKNDTSGVCLYLNKVYFKNEQNDHELYIREYGLKVTYTKEMCIAHEFGHVLEYLMYFKRYNLFDRMYISEAEHQNILLDMKDMEIVCKPIMTKYLDKANINYGKTATYAFIGDYLGSYASKDFGEAFAESIAQMYGHIDNPVAMEIVESYLLHLK